MKNSNTLKTHLLINIATQTLTLYRDSKVVECYLVSTAKNGVGSQQDSGCTPLGKHIIAQKIGSHAPSNSVFVGRVATGEIYNPTLSAQYPKRDWILSRILWLSGLEEGVNKGFNAQGGCDTYQRYIYIHGTPDCEPMDKPLSHGCVRMRNEDIIALYAQVDEGTQVTIVNDVHDSTNNF